MRMSAHRCRSATAALAAAIPFFTGCATSPAAVKQYRYSTPIAPGIAVPDKL